MTTEAAPEPVGGPRGRLVALEGGEGSGKTTQAERLAAALGARLTREPGGTLLGEWVRAVLLAAERRDAPAPLFDALGPPSVHARAEARIHARAEARVHARAEARIDARAEALLFAAARAQHVAEVVAPALEEGRWVVTDRFSGSSLAYQGYGRGLPLEDLRWLSGWASFGIEPDLSVLLVVPPEERARRLASEGRQTDRIEGESAAFHARVHEGYLELAAADPGRWAVLDGTGSPDEVAARVRAAVAERLGWPSAPASGAGPR